MKSIPIEPRRRPSQDRSRERVERILEAAESLIGRYGTGALKMSEIAVCAKVPIGSVYQYYPNREAIIRAIVARYHEKLDTGLANNLSKITTPLELVLAHGDMVENYYNFLRSSPSILNLWSGSLHTRTLLDMSIEDSKRAAQMVYEKALTLLPPKQKDRAFACFLICGDITGSIGKLAISLGETEGAKILSELRNMIMMYIAALLEVELPAGTIRSTRTQAKLLRGAKSKPAVAATKRRSYT